MKKVLIVDDYPGILLGFRRALNRRGYNPVGAVHGHEALTELSNHGWNFDCVITDINMPVMDGWGLLYNLRRQKIDLPVVMLSSDNSLKQYSEKEGAWLFYNKDSDMDMILDGMECVIKKSEDLKKRREYPRYQVDTHVIITGRTLSFQARLRNVSVGGVMFEMNKDDRVEDEFEIYLPGTHCRTSIGRFAKAWESDNNDVILVGARALSPALEM